MINSKYLSASTFTDRMHLWSSFIAEMHIEVMAEIGVWKGEFAEQMLRRCPDIRQYFLIDPWRQLPNWNKPFNVDDGTFENVLAESRERVSFAADRCIELRDTTQKACRKIREDSLDFAYIDGDHTLRGITLDLHSVFPKVKEGGFIAGDDFCLSPWQHQREFEPTLIFPYAVYFAEAMDVPIYALGHNQFVIVKDASKAFSFTDTSGMYGEPNLSSMLSR